MIKNAKSKILGVDTHSAGLSGTATMAEDSAQAPEGLNGGAQIGNLSSQRAGSTGNVVATFTDIITPADSVLVLVVAQNSRLIASGSSSKNWKWQKNGSDYLSGFTMNDASHSANVTTISTIVDASPASGTNTYTLLEDSSNLYGSIKAKIFFIKLTDTHAGVLNGSNTQRTRSNAPIK